MASGSTDAQKFSRLEKKKYASGGSALGPKEAKRASRNGKMASPQQSIFDS